MKRAAIHPRHVHAQAAPGRRKRATASALPEFVEPMLATMGREPFDGDDDWLFEIKWDGFRALCRRDQAGCRLIGRRQTEFTGRFPALVKSLSHLPAGTLLDGEIVALKPDGTQDFTALLRGAGKGRTLAFVAFDLLYVRGRAVMDLPCDRRRGLLRPIIAHLAQPQVLMSEGVVGGGVTYFQQAIGAGLEGVIAKRLDAPYQPGVRTNDWIKLKARKELVAVVVGYELNAEHGLKSLVLAAATEGDLRCVGKVGSGMTPAMANQLLKVLKASEQPAPVIPCSGVHARWVAPALLCRVSYAEILASGRLRQPVLESMVT